jgi:Arc/MetJ-type ribon-helix-helix transcriptional regulator
MALPRKSTVQLSLPDDIEDDIGSAFSETQIRDHVRDLQQQAKLSIQKRGLIQRAYYITIRQSHLIKLIAAQDGTDASALVREAVQKFLDKHAVDEPKP